MSSAAMNQYLVTLTFSEDDLRAAVKRAGVFAQGTRASRIEVRSQRGPRFMSVAETTGFVRSPEETRLSQAPRRTRATEGNHHGAVL